MSEHEHSEAYSTDRHSADAHRMRERRRGPDELGASHDSSGDMPTHGVRRSHFPKDDRRSSARLTEREQNERWPLG